MPNRLKSCKNAGAAQTRTRDVFPWRTSVHFLFYIVWRWIIKIKSMLILSQGFAKACKLFCPTKRFSKNLCAESVPAVCACELDGAENWHLHHLQTEQGGRQLTGKNKGLNMLPVIVKIHEYTLVTSIILLVHRQNYDNLRFMWAYKILLE